MALSVHVSSMPDSENQDVAPENGIDDSVVSYTHLSEPFKWTFEGGAAIRVGAQILLDLVEKPSALRLIDASQVLSRRFACIGCYRPRDFLRSRPEITGSL